MGWTGTQAATTQALAGGGGGGGGPEGPVEGTGGSRGGR